MIKGLKQFNQYNNGRKYGCNQRTQNPNFDFDFPKGVNINLKHKIEFKHNM